MPDGIRLEDGQSDWSGGVNSNVVTTIASAKLPNGLKRNQLAWLSNGTVRTGAIWPRTGWQYLGTVFPASAKWQGGFMYQPDFANPYLIVQVSGQIYQIRVDTDNSVKNLSTQFGLSNPASVDRAFFEQGEQFLVIQPGDFSGFSGAFATGTNPLFWDGVKLTRSLGITNALAPPNTPGINQIPTATAMRYYQNRLWYVQGRTISGGDMVRGNSGTVAYQFRDAILNVTENPLVFGGDGFTVPTNAGNIRAVDFTATLDTSLGQGSLFIFTRKQVYQLIVPVTRADWIGTNNNNQPFMSVAQTTNGAVSEVGLIPINGDLFYMTLQPSIQSLISAIRYYQQWGNVPISINEIRLLQLSNRALLHRTSGIEFDNRALMTALPQQSGQNVTFPAIVPLNFDTVSTLEEQLPPAWEGAWEGYSVLQVFTGDFGGNQRSFALVQSTLDNQLDLYEITNFAQSDVNRTGEARITWVIETPAYDFGDIDRFKELDNAQFWFDRIFGTVEFKLQYREDANPCWIDWYQWKVCAPRSSAEQGGPTYPVTQFCEQDMNPMVMPKAPRFGCKGLDTRPHNLGYQFQLRLTVHGFCRLRELKVFALPKERQHYDRIIETVTHPQTIIVTGT